MQGNTSFALESGYDVSKFDDDGRPKRTGTLVTATAHIITAVIGSGVLSLAWAAAQLGWIAGPIALFSFSVITWFASILLADCYRTPDPVTGRRNHTYMDVVRANLGGRKFQFCGIIQYTQLVGSTIGYTITASISMVAVKRSNCFHRHHIREGCHTSNDPFIMLFGLSQVLLSQIPNFHEISGLSVIAAIMSFAYSFIGLGLSIAHIIGGSHPETGIIGVRIGDGVSAIDKMWRSFSALGNIAFAYGFSMVLIDIQNTLKSSPPENGVMKQATSISISITSFFYILCGVLGYSAFGNHAPGNLLTGFGFFEPFWLVDFANVCIAVHLLGAYQVFAQPIYALVEEWSKKKWPENKFITSEMFITLPRGGGVFGLSIFRLVWRTAFVVLTTMVAMIFPNFNDIVGLLGAVAFWPLTVFFPIEMYMAQAKVRRFSCIWICLKMLSCVCFFVSIMAAAASVRGLIQNLHTLKPFKSES